jgi:hypothetical protein
VDRITQQLTSTEHKEYQEGLERLGTMLSYKSSRPKHQAATDCQWRGVFGSALEVITLEAKVEHTPSGKLAPKDIGQVHNQVARAQQQYGSRGYAVKGTIVTHLDQLDDAAHSSLGAIRIISKDAFLVLWKHLVMLLSQYRDNWSLEDVEGRRRAADLVIPKLPETGWIIRALGKQESFISASDLLTEWP